MLSRFNMVKKYIKLFFFAFLIIFLSSCEKDEICYGDNYVGETPVGNTRLEKTSKIVTVKSDGKYKNIPTPIFDSSGKIISGLPGYYAADDPEMGKWRDSGLSFKTGDLIKIETSGTVTICRSTGIHNPVGAQNIGRKFTIPANQSGWFRIPMDTVEDPQLPLEVRQYDRIEVVVADPTEDSGSNGSKYAKNSAAPNWQDGSQRVKDIIDYSTQSYLTGNYNNADNPGCNGDSCWKIKGRDLRFAISSSEPSNSTSGTFEVGYDCNGNPTTEGSFVCDEPRKTGYLWAKIIPPEGAANYENFVGGYTIYLRHLSCPAYDGKPEKNWGGAMLMAGIVNGGSPNGPNEMAVKKYANCGNQIGQLVPLTLTNSEYFATSSQTIETDTKFDVSEQFVQDDVGVKKYPKIIQANQCGNLWFKIDDNRHWDNDLAYDVKISYGVERRNMDGMIDNVINLVKEVVLGAGEKMLKSTLVDSGFILFLKVLLNIYVAGFFFGYLIGIIQLNAYDVVIRIVKVSIISVLLTDYAFEFFNFYLFGTLTNTALWLINIMTGTPIGENPFLFLTSFFTFLFNQANFFKMFSWLAMGLIGFAYFYILFYAIYVFFKATFEGIKAYIASILYLGMLMAVAPLFLTFMLFSPQGPLAIFRGLFDNWLKFTIRYALEPIFIIVGLFIIVSMIKTILIPIFGNKVCWKCAFDLSFNMPGVDEDVSLFCFKWFLPFGYDNKGTGFGLSIIGQLFSQFILLLFLVKLLEVWVSSASSLVVNLLGAFGTSGAGPAGAIFGSLGAGLKSLFMMDEQGQQRLGQIGLSPGDKNFQYRGRSAFDPNRYDTYVPGDDLKRTNQQPLSDKDLGGKTPPPGGLSGPGSGPDDPRGGPGGAGRSVPGAMPTGAGIQPGQPGYDPTSAGQQFQVPQDSTQNAGTAVPRASGADQVPMSQNRQDFVNKMTELDNQKKVIDEKLKEEDKVKEKVKTELEKTNKALDEQIKTKANDLEVERTKAASEDLLKKQKEIDNRIKEEEYKSAQLALEQERLKEIEKTREEQLRKLGEEEFKKQLARQEEIDKYIHDQKLDSSSLGQISQDWSVDNREKVSTEFEKLSNYIEDIETAQGQHIAESDVINKVDFGFLDKQIDKQKSAYDETLSQDLSTKLEEDVYLQEEAKRKQIEEQKRKLEKAQKLLRELQDKKD